VPPKAHSVPLKFVRQGIQYSDLSAEEKDHWESLDWGDSAGEGAPEIVEASEINKNLFNESTVDLMLRHLMQNGIKVDGGDKLGKTIIFAVNQRHADFIVARFDHHYPRLKGHFTRVITHAAPYAQSLIDDFSNRDQAPQIAVSVDMLDTGIDVPEVVNLVFFKAVRSKVKFLQMIGRGTRLCPDLFGPGLHKSEFFIFDFCGNFEYFNEHPKGAVASTSEPLARRLFQRRLDLLAALPGAPEAAADAAEPKGSWDALRGLRGDLLGTLQGEVAAMNVDNFIVRTELEHVAHFQKPESWQTLDAEATVTLGRHVAGLPTELPAEHITAKLFDLNCLNLQLALINRTSDFERHRERIIELASQLEGKDGIPAVRAELALLQEVQTDEYWRDITLPMIEQMRKRLRGLLQFIERKAIAPVYTVLDDEIGEAQPVTLEDFSTGINLSQYRRKVERFIRAHENHVVIAKLRFNKPLTPTDLAELERFVYRSTEVESRERFEQSFGTDMSLTLFIRTLVGLDRNAAKEAFGRFLNENRYSSAQIRFVEMIIEHLTRNGVMDAGQLYEPPFTAAHGAGLDGVFPDADADAIVSILDGIRSRAAA
jgi:type I restriction enzyme R subunit